MKVLLVDDSRTAREIERDILLQLGCEPGDLLEACCGAAGLDCLSADEPDLVFVDGTMPDMDGVSFVRRARRSGFANPIVIVSSESRGTAVKAGLEAGATDYLFKPYSPDVFAQRVEALVGDGLQHPLL